MRWQESKKLGCIGKQSFIFYRSEIRLVHFNSQDEEIKMLGSINALFRLLIK